MGMREEETLEGEGSRGRGIGDNTQVTFLYDRMGISGNSIHERNLVAVRVDRWGVHRSRLHCRLGYRIFKDGSSI